MSFVPGSKSEKERQKKYQKEEDGEKGCRSEAEPRYAVSSRFKLQTSASVTKDTQAEGDVKEFGRRLQDAVVHQTRH